MSITPPTGPRRATNFGLARPQVYGNCNAPPAVAYSAIIYALRCMVTRDVPLNQVGARGRHPAWAAGDACPDKLWGAGCSIFAGLLGLPNSPKPQCG